MGEKGARNERGEARIAEVVRGEVVGGVGRPRAGPGEKEVARRRCRRTELRVGEAAGGGEEVEERSMVAMTKPSTVAFHEAHLLHCAESTALPG